MTDTNRKNKRIDISAKMHVKMDGAGGVIECSCINLSKTGMLIKTDRPIPVGIKGTLEVTKYLHHEMLEVRARFEVMRASRTSLQPYTYRIGISFIDLDTDSSMNLHEIVEHEIRMNRT